MPVRPTADVSISSPDAPPAPSGGGGSSAGSGGSGGGGSTVKEKPGSSPTGHYSTGMYPVLRGTPDRVEYGPPVKVGPRDTVTIEPVSNNTVDCFYSAVSPDAAKFGPRSRMAPAAVPRSVRVRNLNEIGVYSTVVGEGVLIEHQRG